MPTKTVAEPAAARVRARAARPVTWRRHGALTKRDLVLAVSLDAEIPQEVVYAVLQSCLDRMTVALASGRHIEFRDFGVFELTRRRARLGRNPKRPEDTVTIPERRVVKFKAGKRMKELIAGVKPV